MSGANLLFGGILVLWLIQLINGQLLTMQNIPRWRSVVSIEFRILVFVIFYFILNETIIYFIFFYFVIFQPYPSDGLGKLIHLKQHTVSN